MEYVVYLIASIIAIIVMRRVNKAWLAKGYKRSICSVASGVFATCAFFLVIISAVSLGVLKPKLPPKEIAKSSTSTMHSSDIPQ